MYFFLYIVLMVLDISKDPPCFMIKLPDIQLKGK